MNLINLINFYRLTPRAKLRPFLYILATIIIYVPLYSMPPLPGLKPSKTPVDGVHKNAEAQRLFMMGAPAAAIRKAIAPTGTVKVAVIFVRFTSHAFMAGEITNYTAPGTGYLQKFSDFYAECSSSLLSINCSAFDNGGSGYTVPDQLNSDTAANTGALASSACAAAGVTKASGPYDAVIIVHAGQGTESAGTGTANASIWSAFSDGWTTSAGFTEGVNIPSNEGNPSSAVPFGTLCHEFGHQLGLPDVYNTATGTSAVGEWELMDDGGWAGSPQGSSPVHQSAWCKILLGWITPVTVSSASTLTIDNFESASAGRVYKFLINGKTTEYYLTQYSKQTGQDLALPGQGVLIWHIDDTIGTFAANDIDINPDHPRIRLEERDDSAVTSTGASTGTTSVSHNFGDSGDPFNSPSHIFQSRQNYSYAGVSSGITMQNFTGAGSSSMVFQVNAGQASSGGNAVLSASSYPNPAKGAPKTTVRLLFSSAYDSGTASLNLYTVAGEFVARAPAATDSMVLSPGPGWYADIVWDLNNSGGKPVANGVYFYVFSALWNGQKASRKGKIAVIK